MKLLIFPMIGGRGNCYFQLNAAINIALTHSYEKIVCLVRNEQKFDFEDIDIAIDFYKFSQIDFEYLQFNGFFEKLIWKLIHVQIRFALGNSFLRGIILGISAWLLSLLMSHKLKQRVKIFTSENLGFCEMNESTSSTLCIGYFQSSRYGNFISKLYLPDRELRIKNRSCTTAKKVMIHIRRGDYRLDPDLGVLSFSYYAKIVNTLIETNSELHFSIFSNEDLDDSVVGEIFGKQASKVNVSLYPGNKFGERETFAIMSDNYDFFVIANSSLSYWAATLGQGESSQVICPFPWFRTTPTPGWLYRDAWIIRNAEFETSAMKRNTLL